MALAVLSLLVVPVLGMLQQAQANQAMAIQRHQAHGKAARLVQEARLALADGLPVAEPVQQAAAAHEGWAFRVGVFTVPAPEGLDWLLHTSLYLETWGLFEAGDDALLQAHAQMPLPFESGSQLDWAGLYFLTAEVFEPGGSRAGFSVAKHNAKWVLP